MAVLFDEVFYLNAKLAQLNARGETDANGEPYTLESLMQTLVENSMSAYEHYVAYGVSEGLNPSAFFDTNYYLSSKLAQLNASGETDANGNPYTLETLMQTLAENGTSPLEHYEVYGRGEGLNPNAWFNEVEYLHAKLAQLHSIGEKDVNGSEYTLETLQQAIIDAGMTPIEHYEQYGCLETNQDGTLINPSNAFDANAYVAAKLYQLQNSGTDEEKAFWADKTPADVLTSIVEADMSPVTHYAQYGANEANASKIPMVQTVPSEQRVTNDPQRDVIGQNVPSNYNDPTLGPNASQAAPVTKPADMGGLAQEDISPTVVSPETPVAVPGDSGYVAPTPGTVDTNDNPVTPEVDSESGSLVLPDSSTNTDSDSQPDNDSSENPSTPSTPTTPSTPKFTLVTTDDSIAFLGGNKISFSSNGSTAFFTCDGVTYSVENFSEKTITLESDQTLTAQDFTDLHECIVTGGTVKVNVDTFPYVLKSDLDLSRIESFDMLVEQPCLSFDNRATLTVISEQLDMIAFYDKSATLHIDDSRNTEDCTVEALVVNPLVPENSISSLQAGSGDDFYIMKLAQLSGSFTQENATVYSFHTTANIDGGEGFDSLHLWYDNSSMEQYTLQFDSDFFKAAKNFESFALQFKNEGGTVIVDASEFGGVDEGEIQGVSFNSSARVNNITTDMTIGFVNGGLENPVTLELCSLDYNKLYLDIGNTGSSYMKLVVASDDTVHFSLGDRDYTGIVVANSIAEARATTDTISVVDDDDEQYIVCTGGELDEPFDDWVVQLNGVSTEDLHVTDICLVYSASE